MRRKFSMLKGKVTMFDAKGGPDVALDAATAWMHMINVEMTIALSIIGVTSLTMAIAVETGRQRTARISLSILLFVFLILFIQAFLKIVFGIYIGFGGVFWP